MNEKVVSNILNMSFRYWTANHTLMLTLLAPPRWFRDPVQSHPVQHIGLIVPIYSKLFNNDSAIPKMVRMVRKESGNGQEMSGNVRK